MSGLSIKDMRLYPSPCLFPSFIIFSFIFAKILFESGENLKNKKSIPTDWNPGKKEIAFRFLADLIELFGFMKV